MKFMLMWARSASLLRFLWIVGISMAASAWAYAEDGAPKKYPPYPDVWDWQAPDPKSYVPGWLPTHLLDDGDVLILYMQRKTSDKKRKGNAAQDKSNESNGRTTVNISGKRGGKEDIAGKVESIAFFSGRNVADESSSHLRDDQPLRLSDGVEVLRSASDWRSRGRLVDGTIVESIASRTKDCYGSPARDYFTISQRRDGALPQDDKVIGRKVVFLLLDKPEYWQGADWHLCDEHDHKLKIRVKALAGRVLPLADGGFLVVDDDSGRIVRFSADFSTRSSLLNKKLFVFDTDAFSLFMPEANGKTYITDGMVNMQQLLDDLHDYLVELTKGEK